MTNESKFVTVTERIEAFRKYCEKMHDRPGGSCGKQERCSVCSLKWLELESEEEQPLPCIWCKHDTYVCVGQNYGQVRCKNCMAEGPATDSKEHAIRNYNRVANIVKESEDKYETN